MNLHHTVCVGGLLGFFLASAARAQDSPQNTPSQSAPQQNAPDQQATPSQDPNAPASQAPSAVPPSSVTAPAAFEITGTVHAGKTPLPGVTLTAANTLTGKKFSAATAANGTYAFTGLPRGRYVVRVEFMGFATQTQEVTLKPETPSGKFDVELILASRQQEPTEGTAAAAIAAIAGRGFQSLAIDNNLTSLAGGSLSGNGGANGGGGGATSSDISTLPMNGAGADSATESVSITGAQGRTQDFGSGNEEDLEQRIQEFRERAQREGLIPGGSQSGGPGGAGGPGGGPGGFGGGGPISFRLPRNFNVNQPHGFLYFSDNDAALDARPFSHHRAGNAEGQLQLRPLWGQYRRPVEYSEDFQRWQQMVFLRRLERLARQHSLRFLLHGAHRCRARRRFFRRCI